MIEKVNIKKWGNSAGVRIPAMILAKMDTEVGAALTVEVVNGNLVLKPIRHERPKYNIKDLVAQCDLSAPMPADLVDWEGDSTTGMERL